MKTVSLQRRGFLAGAAGVFTLGWRVPELEAAETGKPVEIGIWAVIHPDDTVVVRVARSEMGQGTLTGLAQLVCEELEADWAKVRAELVPPHVNYAAKRAWGDMSTGGSRGLRTSVDYVRQGGAAARMMLVQAAANQWGVPAGECRAKLGVVSHADTGRSLRFGELAQAAGALPVPKDVPLKRREDWTVIGQAVPRLDTAPKLNGSLKYGIDVQLPNMLSAAVAATLPPGRTSSITSYPWRGSTMPWPWWRTRGGRRRRRLRLCQSAGMMPRTSVSTASPSQPGWSRDWWRTTPAPGM